MFETKFVGNFSKLMGARAKSWDAVAPMSYSVVVPPELDWVMYQELGVDHSYVIPENATGVAFPGREGTISRKQVTHPGLEPTHTIRSVMASAKSGSLKQEVAIAFAEGNYQPIRVKASLVSYVEILLDEIAEQMEVALPGTRAPDPQYPLQAGKLRGRKASEVFRENATVVKND